MSNEEIFTDIEYQLKRRANVDFARSRDRLIKGESESFGVRVSQIRSIVHEYFYEHPEILLNQELPVTIQSFINSHIFEIQMAGIVLESLSRRSNRKFNDNDFKRYEKWLVKYIRDWATCDTLTTDVIAPGLDEDSPSKQFLIHLSKSKNKWARRASLVAIAKLVNGSPHWQAVLNELLPLYTNEHESVVIKAVRWATNRS